MTAPAFGAIHLINLDRDTERLRIFRERNPHITFERPLAILGSHLDRAALARSGMITEDLAYSNPTLGNAHSHIGLWHKAIVTGQPLTIVEDDAVFAYSFASQAERFLAALPDDWGLVLWGYNFDAILCVDLFEGVRTRLTFSQEDLRQRVIAFQADAAPRTALRLRHSFGVMAYTISPRGAQGLVDLCLPLDNRRIDSPGFDFRVDNRTIDCAMNAAYPKLQAFAVFPPLAMSENRHETSTIQGRG